jgi:hypothetical protein
MAETFNKVTTQIRGPMTTPPFYCSYLQIKWVPFIRLVKTSAQILSIFGGTLTKL